MEQEGTGAFEQGRAALAAGDFLAARAAMEQAVAEGGHPGAHQMLGAMAFGQDDFAQARRHWEAAFGGFRDQGDLCTAVRVAAALADLHHSVLGNPSVAAGWIGRARSLLERIGPCVEAGYLALAIVACDVPDMDEVGRNAALALDLALQYGDTDLEVRALSDGGLAAVSQGRIAEGFARLDQAMAAISAGEVADLSAAGKSICAMLTACERAGDLRRAEEWTRLVEQVMVDHFRVHPRVLRMHCRVTFGTALCQVGRWSEAEAELAHALGPDSSISSYHRSLTLSLLADIRLLQGRFEEAAALIRPYEDRLALCGPLARLHLLQGEPAMAAAVALRAIGELRGDRLRTASLLALLVEAELARGDLFGARRAADQLTVLEESGIAVLSAEAAVARGRIAAWCGDHDEALAHFLAANAALAGEELPVLCGIIRLEMAQARAAAGDRHGAVTDARSALAIFERLGADLLTDRTGAFLRHLGWTGRGAGRSSPAGAAPVASLSPREREVLNLVRLGLTNAEIGGRLFISAKTAEHHVGRVLAKLGVRSRAEAAAVATSALHPST
jgi:DNA-binding CsgD family transcriptional regulator